ncbi:malonyl CoA-acyl carrier protein transacylase [Thalassolituus sp. HI0120]|nr:malonyl CoA-acyl carrier protein transacylase [Thalassolituus sp. HI0120]
MTDVIAYFPGQGAQQVGMLVDLSEQYSEIRETFQEASDAIGQDLWALASEGPAESLNLTYNTQPVLLTASTAIMRVLMSQTDNLNIVAAAGHSLGEYSALVAADAIDFADAVKLVKKRGELMDQAVPAGEGGMAAILNLEEEKIREVCKLASGDGVVEPANFNAPGQIVIAGSMPAVEAAIPMAKEAGAKRAMKLVVSGPFHSSLMKAAAEELGLALEAVNWRQPKFPVYHNVDNAPAEQQDIASKLLAQLYSPVNWIGAVEASRPKANAAIEVGPGKVLAGLNKRIDKSLVTYGTSDVTSLQAAIEFIQGKE